tara:strand:+ start:7598 stop:13234 length:5637 start_codon:yes stop_codon:yes gene_type:complete
MPLFSPHYQLDIFAFGSPYSAASDKRRFTIIDSQLAFLSDIVGDGRILGWKVTSAGLTLTVSDGMGIISRFVTRTFGPRSATVTDNRTTFLYMRRIADVVGGFSDFSGTASIVFSDSTAPAIPSGFVIDDIQSTTLTLQWSDNAEVDFDKYIVDRSRNNIDFTQLKESSVSSFIDTGLTPDTVYYYRIRSVDLSGNESSDTVSIFAKTLKDSTVPSNAPFLQSFEGNGLVQLLWEPSPSASIDRYEIKVQELNSGYEDVGTPRTVTVDPSKTFTVVKNLNNGTHYKFTLFSVSTSGIFSQLLERIDTPTFNPNPNEIDNATITYDEGATDDVNIIMKIVWNVGLDPYDPYFALPDLFQITLVENGTRTSEPILVKNKFNRNIQLIPFKDSAGQVAHETVKNNTVYLVRIQTLDAIKNASPGIIVRTQAPIFQEVTTVSNPEAIEQSDLSLFATWDNSSSPFFSHHLLTIRRNDTDGNLEDTILDNSNVGKSNSYLLDNSNWIASKEFQFSIITVDTAGSESLPINFSITTSSDEDVIPPDAPENLEILSGNKNLVLNWTQSPNDFVTSYKIYRSKRELFLEQSDFVVVATVSSTTTSFTDFGLENDIAYAYLITSVDIFGRESPNPIDDPNILFTFAVGVPRQSPTFVAPDNLTVVLSGSHDAELRWASVVDDVSGFEIWRSKNNTFSFELIGTATADALAFVDEDALLVDGTEYFYIIRKFRNESDIIITESNVAPQGSTILAKVLSVNGVLTVDETPAIELKDLEDPVRTETKRQINAHKHVLNEVTGIDRRIDLNVSTVVENEDWLTGDFQRYQTVIDITGASEYQLKVTGTVNDAFFTDENGVVDEVRLAQAKAGSPPILFDIQPDNGTITFEVPLFSEFNDAEATVYAEAPSISLILIGISEAQGVLPAERLSGISATQVVSGQLAKEQMPDIEHEGRIDELLIPIQIDMSTEDQFTYTIVQSAEEDAEEEDLGTARTFYDVIKFLEDELIAATSSGILHSTDFGVSWKVRFTADAAFLKLFYSATLDKYFAFTNNEVFASDSDPKAWSKMAGLPNIKVVRDIVEDKLGNLYVSTDLGVYKLDRSRSSNFFSWEQTPLFGARSTEAYALLYDSLKDRLLVSNEFGVLESTTEGRSWIFIDEFNETKKIFQFAQKDDAIFALTKNEIWRQNGLDDFKRVVDLDITVARKMIIFNDRLYITTNEGAFVSNRLIDICDTATLTMERVWPQINIKNNATPVHGLSIIDDVLFIGTDQRLYMLDELNKISLRFDHVLGNVPSVFINGVLQNVGFRYNTIESNVSFDEKLSFDSVITVANQYKKYKLKHNGWALQKFDAPIEICQDAAVVGKNDTIALDQEIFSVFVFPEYGELNSHVAGADKHKAIAETQLQKLTDIISGDAELATTETLADVVTDVMFSVERFSSQLFESARVVTITDDVGEETEQPFTLPLIIIDLLAVNADGTTGSKIGAANVTTGEFEFSSSFSKFDTLTVDIFGATFKNIGEFRHRKVEDEFELINSGLPSVLSQVQQANIVKLGIFNEKKYPGEQTDLSTPFQSTYVVPHNMASYDHLNSDIDFSLSVENSTVTTALPRAADALYLSEADRVLVVGSNGLTIVRPSNLDIDFVKIGTADEPFAKQLLVNFDKIYALTDKNVFVSEDNGSTWTVLDRTGLPNKLFSLAIIHNNFVVGAEDGIYFRSEIETLWTRRVEATNPVTILFHPDILFTFVDGDIYSSANGADFVKLANFNLTGLEINAVVKFKSIVFTATNSGLHSDGGTFYSETPTFKLEDVLDDSVLSEDIGINDLYVDTNRLIIALDDGRYAILQDEKYSVFTDNNLDVVHQALVVKDDIWLFGFDHFKIPSIDLPILLSTGAPV